MAGAVGRFEARSILVDLLNKLSLQPRISIGCESNLIDTQRWMRDVGRQVPYATAVALTRTAKRLSEMYVAEVDRVFDKPIAFTRRGFGFWPANKSTLTAGVFIKDRQAKYLLPHIVGGRRGLKTFEQRLKSEAGTEDYWAPGQGMRLTAAGNLSLSQIKAIAASLRKSGKYGEVFVGVPRGHAGAPFGIWARPKGTKRGARGGLTPLLVRIATPNYKRRFDFYGFAQKHAPRIFDEELRRAWPEALRKVRPISQQLIRH